MQKKYNKLERGADIATQWIGSTNSIIIHTSFFLFCFILVFLGISFDRVLLVLNTIVSLEAVYLAIFIQMSVNKANQDIEDIQENVEDIQEDVDEIQKDVDEIQEDIEEIEEDSDEDLKTEKKEAQIWTSIQTTLADLQKEIEELKKK